MSVSDQPPEVASPTIDHTPAEGPGTRLGPYKLLQQLGEGGMGTVFMAEQEQPVRRRVALKVIKPGMDSAHVLARFRAEQQALALMDHPHIARVFDAGVTASGRPYFVMELVHGVPITKYCDDHKLTPRERLELFVPVCRAVQHAHQKGIIHRDLKPSNVLVCLYDGKPVAKVIDFGVAKAMEQPLTEQTMFTQFGQVIGTLEYMSPEQAEMSQLGIDTRSDIYSLGVMLYELLSGSTPLQRQRLKLAARDEVLRLIREEEPPAPSARLSSSTETLPTIAQQRHTEPAQLRRLLRGELDWIALKALEKDRTRRYATADSLARDIERHLADEPVEASPPSVTYRLRKYARKHRALLTTAAVIMLLLVLGVAGSAWQAMRAWDAEEVALAAEDKAAKERDQAVAFSTRLREAQAQLRETLYASRASLLQAAWNSNNMLELDRLLDEMRPGPGEPDLRGFEWHYWQRLCPRPVRTRKVTSSVYPFTLSGDASRLVGFIKDPQEPNTRLRLRIIDPVTGKDIPSAFTIRNDNLEVLTGPPISHDGKRCLWDNVLRDLATGKPVTQGVGAGSRWLFPVHASIAREFDRRMKASMWTTLTFSLRGDRAVLFECVPPEVGAKRPSPPECNVAVYDCATGKVLCALPSFAGITSDIVFTPDGDRIAILAYTPEKHLRTPGHITIWDVATARELVRIADQPTHWPGACHKPLCFSPDGQQLVSVSYFDPAVKVWNAVTGELQYRLRGLPPLREIAFSARDGLLYALDDFNLHVVDVSPPPPARFAVQDIAARGQLDEKRRGELRINPTTELVTLAAPSGEGLVVDRHGNEQLRLHQGEWYRDFASNGARLLTQVPKVTSVWDLRTKKPIFSSKELVADPLTALSARGTYLASAELLPEQQAKLPAPMPPTASVPSQLALWHVDTSARVGILQRPQHQLLCGVFSPQENIYAAAGFSLETQRRTVVLWDIPSCRELRTLELAAADEVGNNWALAFSPDGSRLAAGLHRAGETEVIVWEVATGKQLFARKGPEGMVTALAFSPDSRRLAAFDNQLDLWDMAGRKLLSLKVRYQSSGGPQVHFSADGHRLFVAGISTSKVGDLIQEWNATPLAAADAK